MRSLLVVFIAVLFAACTSSHPAPADPLRNLQLSLEPGTVAPGGTFTLSYSFEGGVGPFEVSEVWDGAQLTSDHAVDAQITEHARSGRFTVPADTAPGPVTLRVSVSELVSHVGLADEVTLTVEPAAGPQLRQPSIARITFTDPIEGPQPQVMDVEVTGTPGLVATVTLSAPASLQIDRAGRNVTFCANVMAHATFELVPIPQPGGGTASITVAVDGPHCLTSSKT